MSLSYMASYKYSKVWGIAYAAHGPIVRILGKLGLSPTHRHPFLLGRLNKTYLPTDLRQLLAAHGFEKAVLAWPDPGEVLNMRKVDRHKFQWHIRVHLDGEIRGHYEDSPEGSPWGHIVTETFREDEEYFVSLLGDYLVSA